MLKVQFSNVDEFFEEIQKDREQIHRSIVRVTLHRSDRDQYVKIALVSSAYIDETIVHLRAFVGDCHAYDRDTAQKLWDLGLSMVAALTTRLKGLALDVRNGAWQSE